MVWRAACIADKLCEEEISIGVLNISTPFALDNTLLDKAIKTGFVLTYEDHNVRNGLGSLIANYIAENGLSCRFVKKGITKYGISATPEKNYEYQGLDEKNIIFEIKNILSKGENY